MKLKLVPLSILLMAVMLISCEGKKQKLVNEWKMYYDEEIASVSDKIDFINEKFAEIDSYDDCDVYDMDDVSLWTLVTLAEDVIETPKDVDIDSKKACFIYGYGYKKYSNSANLDDLKSPLKNYEIDINQSVKNIKYDIESAKEELSHSLPKINSLEYLVVIEDQVFVKPKVEKDSFYIGYLNSHVEVYDLSDYSLVDDYYVTVQNDDEVFTYTEEGKTVDWQTLINNDLYRNMESAIHNNLVAKFPELKD